MPNELTERTIDKLEDEDASVALFDDMDDADGPLVGSSNETTAVPADLPELEIVDGAVQIDFAAEEDSTSAAASIQAVILKVNQQLTKQLGDALPEEVKKLVREIEEEKERGEFGPASQKAFKSMIDTLQNKQLPNHLRALAEFGIPVPPGFPVDGRIDGSMESLQLFSRRITSGNYKLDLKIDQDKPTEADAEKLVQAFDWLIAADSQIEKYAKERELTFLQGRIKELGLKEWDYKEGDDKAGWLKAAKAMVDLSDRASNNIRAMHYLYKSSRNSDFPLSLPKGSSITVAVEGGKPVILDSASINAPEHRDLLKNGSILSIQLDLPGDLRADHLGNKKRIDQLNSWLDKEAKPISDALVRLNDAHNDSRSIIFWGEDEVANGQAVFDSQGQFTGKVLTRGENPGIGETTKPINLVNYDFTVEEIKSGPDKGKMLIKQTVEAADAAPWAYQNIRWLGVDTVGKPLQVEHKPLDKDAFVPIRSGNTIELVQVRNLEGYKASRKFASFSEKTITGLMDTAMVLSGTIELRAAMKASQLVAPSAQAALKLTERETLAQVGHGLFRVSLGGSGLLNNAGGKELSVLGVSGQDFLALRSLIFVGEAAKGIGMSLRSSLSVEAPSLNTAGERVRAFIHGQKETAVLPALPQWDYVRRVHKGAEYTFRTTEVLIAPQIVKELHHQIKDLSHDKKSDPGDEALAIYQRLLGIESSSKTSFDYSNKDSLDAARTLLQDYERMLSEGKSAKVQESVRTILSDVRSALDPEVPQAKRQELINRLAQELTLSADELKLLELSHPDSSKHEVRLVTESEITALRNGTLVDPRMRPLVEAYDNIMKNRQTSELSAARAIGLLYLSRGADGQIPNGINFSLPLPEMEREIIDASESGVTTSVFRMPSLVVEQTMTSQQLVAQLLDFAGDKKAGNNVITGGDVLLRVGAINHLNYGLALQDVLSSTSASREDKLNALFDSRGGRMAASFEMAVSHDSTVEVPAGSRPQDFVAHLKRTAAAEKDADVKAAMVASAYIFEQKSAADRVLLSSWLNASALKLRGTPGELAKAVESFLREKATKSDSPVSQRIEAALALLAVSNDDRTKKLLASATDEIVASKNVFALAELLTPEKMQTLAAADVFKDRQRFERLFNTGLALLVPSDDAKTEAAIMALAQGLNALQNSHAGVNSMAPQKLAKTLRDWIDPESRIYAGDSPNLRVFAINSLAEVGDQKSLSLIKRHLSALPDKTSGAVGETSPLVRSAALKAVERLRDPELPQYLSKLVEKETDPVLAEMMSNLSYDIDRAEPTSKEYKLVRERLSRELLAPSSFDDKVVKEATTETLIKFLRDNAPLLEGATYTSHSAAAIDSASSWLGRRNPFWSSDSVTNDERSKLNEVFFRRCGQMKELMTLSQGDNADGKLATLALAKMLTDKRMTDFLGGSDSLFFKHEGEYASMKTPQLPFETMAAQALRANSAVGQPHRDVTAWAVRRALTNGGNLTPQTIIELIGALKELRQGDQPQISRNEAVALVMNAFEENITRLPKEQSEAAQALLVKTMLEFRDRGFIPVLDAVAQFSDNPRIKQQAQSALEQLRDAGKLMWDETSADKVATPSERSSAASRALLSSKDTEATIQTLFNAYKGYSVKEGDPALTWLRRALNDKDERIQLAATRILINSGLPKNHPLIQQATTTLSKLSRETKRQGLRFEALELFASLSDKAPER